MPKLPQTPSAAERERRSPSRNVTSESSVAYSPLDPSAQMLGLQQTVGNQAVQRQLAQATAAPQGGRDLWKEYTAAQQALNKFKQKKYTANNFQSSTGGGMFDVQYDPANNILRIVCECSFAFANGTATEYPKAKPADLAWTEPAKLAWKQNFMAKVEQAWSNQHTFHCEKDWWESLKAKVVVDFKEVSTAPHFNVTVTKIPAGEFRRSTVTSAVAATGKTPYRPGKGTFDSNDLDAVNKGIPNMPQTPAVHEAGHMLGLDDEYETGSKNAPRHSGLVQKEFGHAVARGKDGRIMSNGTLVQPEHGVTFLAGLKQATGMQEWSSTAKTPKPVPQNPQNSPAKAPTSQPAPRPKPSR